MSAYTRAVPPGLRVINAYLDDRDGTNKRRVCLIPESAHGTNAASAAMAGMQIVAIKTDRNGNVDMDDVQHKADQHAGTERC